VPERTDDDGRWTAAVVVVHECESESEAASESRRRGEGGMGIRDLGLGMEREAAGSGLYMRWGGLASWAASLAGPNEAVGAPGRLFAPGRARAVPRAGVAVQAQPGASGRAGPGPLANGPCHARAGPKCRATGRASGPRAAWPTIPALLLPSIHRRLPSDHIWLHACTVLLPP